MTELACLYRWADGQPLALTDGELIEVGGCTPGEPAAVFDEALDVQYDAGMSYMASAEFKAASGQYEAGYLCLNAVGDVIGRVPCLLVGEPVGADWVQRRRPVRGGWRDDFAIAAPGTALLRAYVAGNNGSDPAALQWRNWRIVAMPRIDDQD